VRGARTGGKRGHVEEQGEGREVGGQRSSEGRKRELPPIQHVPRALGPLNEAGRAGERCKFVHFSLKIPHLVDFPEN